MSILLDNQNKKERELSLSDYCPINTPTSSPNIVYQRKNIKSVEATGSEDDFTYKPKHWEYEERELTQDEYSQYLIAMEQAKEINEHSDEEAIDNYTRQLMDEGVL